MMAVPKRKTSSTKRDKRRTHQKPAVPGMTECPNCGEMKLSHRICNSCGHYKGREVVSK